MGVGDLVKLKTIRPYEVFGIIVSPAGLESCWQVYWIRGLPFSSRKTRKITMERESTLEVISESR